MQIFVILKVNIIILKVIVLIKYYIYNNKNKKTLIKRIKYFVSSIINISAILKLIIFINNIKTSNK